MTHTSNISQYRDRLDQTLSCPDLVNYDVIKTLLKNQMLRSSECDYQECGDNLVEKRTDEVTNLLSMLRSVSVNDGEKAKSSEVTSGGWKVKQDTDEYRVMYREGPEGTPFHTLLCEGYVDGSVDVCLCLSWGAEFYKKWWPQSTIPSFRVSASECLKKVRAGEQICLVRMKLSWPLSTREALVHFFVFEYFQEGLIVVLINSISDIDSVDKTTHGFSKDGIPLPEDVVRIDVVGGFAVQKVTDNRSYFRTIANMDIKLDFVPASFINFVSRQLIGAGFKLYKKEVASVAKGDEDFSNALKDPLYVRIRNALYSDSRSNGNVDLELLDLKKDVLWLDEEKRNGNGPLELQDSKEDTCVTLDEGTRDSNGALEFQDPTEGACVHVDQGTSTNVDDKSPQKKVRSEIEEIEEDKNETVDSLDRNDMKLQKIPASYNKKVVISSEVRQALGTLEKAISIIRDFGYNLDIRSVPSNPTVKSGSAEEDGRKDGKSSETDLISQKELSEVTPYEHRSSSASHGSRRTSTGLCTREANHKKIAPASPDDYVENPGNAAVGEDNVPDARRKEIGKRKRKLPFYCSCLFFFPGQIMG